MVKREKSALVAGSLYLSLALVKIFQLTWNLSMYIDSFTTQEIIVISLNTTIYLLLSLFCLISYAKNNKSMGILISLWLLVGLILIDNIISGYLYFYSLFCIILYLIVIAIFSHNTQSQKSTLGGLSFFIAIVFSTAKVIDRIIYVCYVPTSLFESGSVYTYYRIEYWDSFSGVLSIETDILLIMAFSRLMFYISAKHTDEVQTYQTQNAPVNYEYEENYQQNYDQTPNYQNQNDYDYNYEYNQT